MLDLFKGKRVSVLFMKAIGTNNFVTPNETVKGILTDFDNDLLF